MTEVLRWDGEVDGVTTLPVRLLAPLEWRWTEDRSRIELWLPRHGRWKSLEPRFVPILEGLAAGERPAEMRARLARAEPDLRPEVSKYVVIKFLSYLKRRGLLEVRVPEVPPVFADRFEVVRELGRGGMSVVWLCRDRAQGGAPVAVKHAWNWQGRFAAREEALEREAEVLRALRHPRVVAHVADFVHDGRFHLAREFADGEPLSAVAKAAGGLDADAARRHLRRMVEVLAYIRDAGWMYADFKPVNFFVGEGGDLKLGDLGLCRPIGPDGRARGVFGTDAYSPPEVYRTKHVDEAALVFAAGRALLELATGEGPKPTTTPERLRARLAEEPQALRAKGLDEASVALFLDCCALEPEKRPALAAVLERLA